MFHLFHYYCCYLRVSTQHKSLAMNRLYQVQQTTTTTTETATDQMLAARFTGSSLSLLVLLLFSLCWCCCWLGSVCDSGRSGLALSRLPSNSKRASSARQDPIESHIQGVKRRSGFWFLFLLSKQWEGKKPCCLAQWKSIFSRDTPTRGAAMTTGRFEQPGGTSSGLILADSIFVCQKKRKQKSSFHWPLSYLRQSNDETRNH